MRRGRDVDLVDPGRARRDGAHDHRRRVGMAAAGGVDRGAPHGHLAQRHGLTLGERDRAIVVESGLGDGAHVGDRGLEAGPHVGVERVERDLERGVRKTERGAERAPARLAAA